MLNRIDTNQYLCLVGKHVAAVDPQGRVRAGLHILVILGKEGRNLCIFRAGPIGPVLDQRG